MRELKARTLVVVRSSRTNDGRRTGERSRLAAVPFRSTVARAVRYLRARPRRRASRSRFSTKRSERGPLRRRRRRRHSAASPSARRRRQGRADRPAGRSVPVCRARGRQSSVPVGPPPSSPRTGRRAHINTHPRPRATTPFAPATLFYNNNIIYILILFLSFSHRFTSHQYNKRNLRRYTIS